jgi:hypothetical protein
LAHGFIRRSAASYPLLGQKRSKLRPGAILGRSNHREPQLCAPDQRPCRCAPEPRDQLPPSHPCSVGHRAPEDRAAGIRAYLVRLGAAPAADS